MNANSDVVTLPDGRRIHLRRYGDPAGRPVVMLHGTPGSSLLFTATDAPARALGLAVIAPDRWGYGASDAPPTPALAGYATDVATMMTALGYDAFAVSGFSGGGPYAAAVAAGLGGRVTGVAMVSPVGLIAESLAAGELGAMHRFCFGPLARWPSAVEAIFRGFHWTVRRAPRIACGLTTLRAPRADQQIIGDCAVSERLLRAFQDGLKNGARGPAIDLALFGAPWPFDPGTIVAPAKVWIGTKDANVPIAAAQRLAHRIAHAELELLDGEGHLWVAQHYLDILAWISKAWREPEPVRRARSPESKTPADQAGAR